MGRFTFASRYCEAGRLLGAVLGRPLIGPRAVSLEVTHHCNLRCIFCESHGSLRPVPITAQRQYAGGRRVMDLATIRRLAKEFARERVDLVQLSGKGDPIAHPEMTEIVAVIKESGVGCALVTNGTLASPDFATALVEARLDRLTVSINAGTREVYRRISGSDLLDKATAAVRDVLERRRATGRNRPWVRVSHIVCRENTDDFDSMAATALELGVDEVVWNVMGELPETAHLGLTSMDTARLLEAAPSWAGRLDQAGIVHNIREFTGQIPLRDSGEEIRSNQLQRAIPCYEGWFFCVIAPDGVVVPCCYCEEEVLGNIHDRSFGMIWRGAGYRSFRRNSLEIPRTGRPVCAECFTICNKASQNLHIYRRTHPCGPRLQPRGPNPLFPELPH